MSIRLPEEWNGLNWRVRMVLNGTHPGTQVFKVQHSDPATAQDTLYAVRVFTLPTRLDSDFHVDVNEDLIRFLKGKNMHNCINIHDVIKEIGHIDRLWVKMDWGSSSLRTLLDTGWIFTGALWLDVMRGIANGMGYLHSSNIFHVFARVNHDTWTITWDQVFVSDIGARSWFLEYSRERGRSIKIPGTREYVSPEVLKRGGDESVTAASDIWSIGCIGAELVTNRPLFASAEKLEAYIEDQSRVDSIQYELIKKHAEVEYILGGCLRVDPSGRPSVFYLRAELENQRRAFPS